MNSVKLWRIHLRSAAQNGKSKFDIVDYCINNNIVGLGWRLDEGCIPKDADDYAISARKRYGKKVASVRFAQLFKTIDPRTDHLIWARGTYAKHGMGSIGSEGKYYLGKIIGPWTYSAKKEHLDLDIPNQAECLWTEIGTEECVPGKVRACFRPRATMQEVKTSDELKQYCAWLFNQGVSSRGISATNLIKDVHQPAVDNAKTFFGLVDNDDCEDIVGVFLQKEKGYIFLPGTQQRDTQGTEYYLKDPKTGETIAVQVKQGKIDLLNNLRGHNGPVYLFSTEGRVSESRDNIHRLSSEELFDFVCANAGILPDRITNWINGEK